MTDNDCTHCRACGGKMEVIDSRPIRAEKLLGFRTQKRFKKCKVCGERYATLEIPENDAKDFYMEDW